MIIITYHIEIVNMSLDDEKSDLLILITEDHKEINYSIKKFSKISKLFKEQINCESFNKFSNKKFNGSIEYLVATKYKLIDWILNIYYVSDHFDNLADLHKYRTHEIDLLNKLILLDIYSYGCYMNMVQLKYHIEKYFCNEMVDYFVPNIIEPQKTCFRFRFINNKLRENSYYNFYPMDYNKNDISIYVFNKNIFYTFRKYMKSTIIKDEIKNKIIENIFIKCKKNNEMYYKTKIIYCSILEYLNKISKRLNLGDNDDDEDNEFVNDNDEYNNEYSDAI